MRYLSVALLTLLIGCGGGGGGSGNTNSPVVPITPPTVTNTGIPYYEMENGTYQTFTIQLTSAAHWDNNTHEVIIDASAPGLVLGHKFLVEQYSMETCPGSFGNQQLYVNTYSFNDTGLPLSVLDPTTNLIDGFFTSTDGIPFFGEVMNPLGHGDIGEPIIATNLVAGQHIHTVETLMGPCGDNTVLSTGYQTDYYTVKHLDSWNGWTDVWFTSLIETPVTGAKVYYEFVYARHTATQFGGLVASWGWNGAPNGYSCCNFYMAIPKSQ